MRSPRVLLALGLVAVVAVTTLAVASFGSMLSDNSAQSVVSSGGEVRDEWAGLLIHQVSTSRSWQESSPAIQNGVAVSGESWWSVSPDGEVEWMVGRVLTGPNEGQVIVDRTSSQEVHYDGFCEPALRVPSVDLNESLPEFISEDVLRESGYARGGASIDRLDLPDVHLDRGLVEEIVPADGPDLVRFTRKDERGDLIRHGVIEVNPSSGLTANWHGWTTDRDGELLSETLTAYGPVSVVRGLPPDWVRAALAADC